MLYYKFGDVQVKREGASYCGGCLEPLDENGKCQVCDEPLKKKWPVAEELYGDK